VLGFFRIWGRWPFGGPSGFLGHFRPEFPLLLSRTRRPRFRTRGRIRAGSSRPHVLRKSPSAKPSRDCLPGSRQNHTGKKTSSAVSTMKPTLLFSPEIRGGRDIESSITGGFAGASIPTRPPGT
jgi:hypothetical protein